MTNAEKTALISTLQECEEYFANRADAWAEGDEWVETDENRLLGRVAAALDMLGNAKLEPAA